MLLFYKKIKLKMMNNMNINPMTFNAMLNMMNILYPNMGYNINNFNMYNNQFLIYNDELDAYESFSYSDI